MSENPTTPPRAPVFQQPTFRCAECGAIWRTERQRDRCCTAKPETVQQTTPPPRLFVWSAIASRRSGLNTDVQGEFGVLTAANEDEVRGAALRIVMDKRPGHSVEFVSVGEVPPALIEEAGYGRR